MATEIIRDNMGKMIGKLDDVGDRIVLKEWASGKILATYFKNQNRTVGWEKNDSSTGNQVMRYLKG